MNVRTSFSIIFLLVSLLFVILYYLVNIPILYSSSEIEYATETEKPWPITCVDTMKTSRDNARRWAALPNLQSLIDGEMQAIVEMQANCVAIGTPYDEEFLPYLKLWVQSAREHQLKVWFRGNFSQWENWFEYSGDMSIEQLFSSGTRFVENNPDLFLDGDIFTLAPEAENGGPFDQVELDEHESYRQFLINKYNWCTAEFLKINKEVTCNWLSMNGGLAMRMYDQETIDAIGGVVTIDHYIKTPEEMGEFIRYFADNFQARVVVGEFGAPIPQINGDMDEEQQAEFVEKLLREIYMNRADIDGINYWILFDGSTHLLNPDYSPRESAMVIKKYMQPATINILVSDTEGNPIPKTSVYLDEQYYETDSMGKLQIQEYMQSFKLEIEKENYDGLVVDHTLRDSRTLDLKVSLRPSSKTMLESISEYLRQLTNS
jgi:hypothetical protein